MCGRNSDSMGLIIQVYSVSQTQTHLQVRERDLKPSEPFLNVTAHLINILTLNFLLPKCCCSDCVYVCVGRLLNRSGSLRGRRVCFEPAGFLFPFPSSVKERNEKERE
ncbi:hypothetical protein QQF64_032544 [Cirrhinus molitorella]|uniref:Uncharacterized protein n=1 Tax=Cirrhinus molitorella TaxID=172907 RepID=A0ABR3N004_9TELE